MAIPAINVLGNPNVTEGNFQIAIEDLRKSVIGSGKAYDSANTYSQYDTCVSGGIVYYSKIDSNTGNTPIVGVNWGLIGDLITGVVHNVGNETIAGTKTFSTSPIVPTPTTNTQAANKQYADLKVALSDFTGANVSFGSNGYQKLPSGLIIQWGAATSNSWGQAALALPIAFPNAIISGSASYFVNTHSTHMVSLYAEDYKPASISALATSTINGSAITGAQVKFIVIGY